MYACCFSFSCSVPPWRSWVYLLDSTGRLLWGPSQCPLIFQAKQVPFPQYLFEGHVLLWPSELAWIYCCNSCTGGSRIGCVNCRLSDKSRVKKNCFLLIQPRMPPSFAAAGTCCTCVYHAEPPDPSNPLLFGRTVLQPVCPEPVVFGLVVPKVRT